MGSAGFRSGKMTADSVKVGTTYLNERQFIWKELFDTTYISGTAATATTLAGTSAMSVPVYKFGEEHMHQVAFRLVAPASLKSNTKCNLRVYWTVVSGSLAGDVVWDADYWVASVLASGVVVGGRNYCISGGATRDGNCTVTSEPTTRASQVSGIITSDVMAIPAGEIAANDLVRVMIYRDGVETADTLAAPAYLIGVLVEYVDG